MKQLLITAIAIMIIMLGCNIEENAGSKEPNYTNAAILLPCIILSLYALTHLNEVKKFINGN